MSPIEIRALREDEWMILKDLRLKAVRDNPRLFLCTYEQEAARPDADWLDLIRLDDRQVFGLFDGPRLIGLTAVFKFIHDPEGHTVKLGMSYIEPEYRGRGLSRLLYTARLDWARDKGFKRAIVSHRDGNEASRRANAAFGFAWYESEELEWAGGERDLDHRYELFLL